MKIAILGSGPAGLVAAAAADHSGLSVDVDIFSLGVKSPLYGAQYLHAPIPEFSEEDDVISVKYDLIGSHEGYRRKVYGDMVEVEVSTETLEESHPAWDIRGAYDRLWEQYGILVDAKVLDIEEVQRISKHYDIVISTIPAPKICSRRDRHYFGFANVRAAGSAPDIGIHLEDYWCEDGTVLCSGRLEDDWYRISNIFGHKTVEFPLTASIYPTTSSVVQKPIDNTCDCWEGTNLHRAGRYGSWTKGVLIHQVYDQVEEILWGLQ